MLLPTDLLPASVGLQWGMRKSDCLTLLRVTPSRQHPLWALVPVRIRDEHHELELHFGDRDRLERMRVNLYTSRSFWDDDPPWETGEVEMLWKNADALYRRLTEEATAVLGPPVFSGSWEDPDYPEGEVSGDLTYWNHPGDRLQLLLEQPDRELPIVVALVSSSIINATHQPSG